MFFVRSRLWLKFCVFCYKMLSNYAFIIKYRDFIHRLFHRLYQQYKLFRCIRYKSLSTIDTAFMMFYEAFRRLPPCVSECAPRIMWAEESKDAIFEAESPHPFRKITEYKQFVSINKPYKIFLCVAQNVGTC